MASIRSVSSGNWEIRISAGTDADGRRRRISRTVAGSREDAEREALRMEYELGASPSADMTLDAYFWGAFLPSRSDLSPATLENYRFSWSHVSDAFGSRQLSEPSHAEVQRWVSSMSRGTAMHSAKLLRSVLRDAWRDGLLAREPMAHPLRYPKDETPAEEVWDARQAVEALEALRGTSVYTLALLMLGAGLRRSEALAVDWERISWDGGTCSVTVDRTRHRGQLAPTKNASSVRTVAMGEPFASLLREASQPSGAVCPLTEDAARSAWRRLCADGGRLHGMAIPMKNLRHTHESLMHDAGIADTTISQIHGHADVRTDYRHYIARSSASARYAAERLGEYMREEAGGAESEAGRSGMPSDLRGFWSGGLDSNQRPLDPQSPSTEPTCGDAERFRGWRLL